MYSAASEQETSSWLVNDSSKELELLLWAVLSHQSEAILIADDSGHCVDASAGAGKLLGISMRQMIGESINALLQPNKLQHAAAKEVLPGRHVLLLNDDSGEKNATADGQDYAFLSLDSDSRIVAWQAGAERVYGYASDEIIGQHVSCLYLDDAEPRVDDHAETHFASEAWHKKKDGSRFWANSLTTAHRNQDMELEGFARVVRDFSVRHGINGAAPTIAGIVSGEFDRIVQANDAFLNLVGYSREEFAGSALRWADIVATECLPLQEHAHEESMLHGACTPFELNYIRKDDTRVRVQVAIALLPPSPFRWIAFVQDLSERDRAEKIADQPGASHEFEEIVGTSAALKRVMGQVEIVAPTDATVLVLGETGTGKELIARAIHKTSGRRNRPFITLNCAAIPTGLLESELFGYERGAFTGALSQKIGRFERAHQGTLFLDEVGDIPLELQPKLLRALQEKEFERLGGTRTIPIDVRLLAATNRNLTQMMGDKLFRSDLYYRLKVFPITIPPLREHREDIPVLVRHFTQTYASKMNKQIDKIPSETMQALVAWSWPGNVRELENFIERSVILSPGSTLRAPLAEIRADAAEAPAGASLAEVEREHIVRVLKEANGVVSAAAARLGLPRTTLNAMMRKLEISRKDL
ncbi:MAG: sigma 54-interacting transcriptional regulator [Bryobacteraceae bacterium]|jgi:PAS domain S-box-containing protein